ncbi:MAG: aldehyde dehydrogenase family protein [Phycisphaerales bacterium]|nr:MAG: aldehyde dehydrogenase family protein [Phycisphaerales bacterium]
MKQLLSKFGIEEVNPGGFAGQWCGSDTPIESVSPIDGTVLARVNQVSPDEFETIMTRAQEAFTEWRKVPAPVRGQTVRDLGNALREVKADLGALVTLEMGKIRAEGEGEVQEMIDICDFAVGLSRQLYGLTMHSERPGHRMYEQWHPLGVVGVISAFNFPVAVWSWNCALAAVCGDVTLWKPSSKTPLTAIACTKVAEQVCKKNGVDPAIFSLCVGRGSTVGEKLIHDRRIPLVSATGSCRMGYRIGAVVGERLGRTILELGGNNAIIVSQHADMDMAIPAILFGAVGTAGQRCTSTRRIIVHESARDALVKRLIAAYEQVRIGDPLEASTLMGPLIDTGAVDDMATALVRINKEGGEVLYGGERLGGDVYAGGCYVKPCIVSVPGNLDIVKEETFAPILYVMTYGALDEAIALHNDVPQGLSSAIFTRDLLEAEQFLSCAGSDCGIANVNIGTSGAEIGGAFGGEKETGGGRESGSDAWKAYMRRQTNTINYSTELPLAQGIKFGE